VKSIVLQCCNRAIGQVISKLSDDDLDMASDLIVVFTLNRFQFRWNGEFGVNSEPQGCYDSLFCLTDYCKWRTLICCCFLVSCTWKLCAGFYIVKCCFYSCMHLFAASLWPTSWKSKIVQFLTGLDHQCVIWFSFTLVNISSYQY
jgi:hypothetical protein